MRTVGKKLSKQPKMAKKDVIAILKEKEIEFDENANLETLKKLLPKE